MSFALLKPSRHDVYPFIDPTDGLKGAAAGKRILISGAGTGIGQGIAESFASAGAASLILVARRAGPLEETKAKIAELAPSCQVTTVPNTDVSDRQAVESLFEDSSSLPDVVVSNAAFSRTSSIADSDPDTWWSIMDVNLRGPLLDGAQLHPRRPCCR